MLESPPPGYMELNLFSFFMFLPHLNDKQITQNTTNDAAVQKHEVESHTTVLWKLRKLKLLEWNGIFVLQRSRMTWMLHARKRDNQPNTLSSVAMVVLREEQCLTGWNKQ